MRRRTNTELNLPYATLTRKQAALMLADIAEVESLLLSANATRGKSISPDHFTLRRDNMRMTSNLMGVPDYLLVYTLLKLAIFADAVD